MLDLADAPEEVRQQLARWEQLFAALRQKWVEPLETRNSRNGQTFQKFGVWAQPLPPLGCSSSGDGQRVRLGPPVDSKEMAQLSFPLDGVGVDEDGQPPPEQRAAERERELILFTETAGDPSAPC